MACRSRHRLGQRRERITEEFGGFTHALVVSDQGPVLGLVGARQMQCVQGTEWHLRVAMFEQEIRASKNGRAEGAQIDDVFGDVLIEELPGLPPMFGGQFAVTFPGQERGPKLGVGEDGRAERPPVQQFAVVIAIWLAHEKLHQD
jgi:hypothetical protein